MPSQPPETPFYNQPDNYTLWRDVSRTYEDFMGDDKTRWAQHKEAFVTVLEDILVMLRESKESE